MIKSKEINANAKEKITAVKLPQKKTDTAANKTVTSTVKTAVNIDAAIKKTADNAVKKDAVKEKAVIIKNEEKIDVNNEKSGVKNKPLQTECQSGGIIGSERLNCTSGGGSEGSLERSEHTPYPAAKSVLFAASECQPFIATGGLAEVLGSLPKAIAETGVDVRVILPLYADMNKVLRDKLAFLGSTHIDLVWRKQYCGIFTYKENNVTYYFIDNEYYFNRHGIYGHYDDGERFAYFSKSVIDICKFLHYYPQIIHCSDWQTGLIPIYLKTIYAEDENLKNIKTIFTIHNIEYQGKFSIDILEDVLAIPSRFASLAEYDGSINIVKGAVQCCDMVTTVSPTYAQEILTPYFSQGLHFILKDIHIKLRGILNGIDYETFNPLTDKALFKNYDINTIDLKGENKTELQKLFNLPVDPEIPMIAIITRLVSHKGMDLIKNKLEDILHEKVQVIILGKGEIIYENLLLDLQKVYSEKLRAVIAYNPDLARKIYAAADIFLMPSKSEPCGLAQMIASRYGAVPIVRETGGLSDSIKDIDTAGGGNGFTFANYNADDMYNRIIYAVNLYLNKKKWAELVKRVMGVDFTWNKSAKLYIELYNQII